MATFAAGWAKRGYTLIELLVSVAIVLILIVLLVPAAARVYRMACDLVYN